MYNQHFTVTLYLDEENLIVGINHKGLRYCLQLNALNSFVIAGVNMYMSHDVDFKVYN